MIKKGKSKCRECGGERVTTVVGPFRMPLSGGWSVTVEDAQTTHCPDCGGMGLLFTHLGPMMHAIAAAIVLKPTRLAAEEIRFLRTHLGYTGRGLAKLLGVGAPTVSRWENGKEPIGAVPDRLLRTLEVIREGVEGFDVEALAAIGDEAGAPLRIRVRMKDGQWKAAA